MTRGRSLALDVLYSVVYEAEIAASGSGGGTGTNSSGSSGGKWKAGDSVELNNVPFYYASTSTGASAYKSGTFYFYDGILINGRYRMTITADRCGKKPIPVNVTGWVRAEDCGSGSGGGGETAVKKETITKQARQIEGEVESLTYTDSASNESDSLDLTMNAEDEDLPEKGAVLRPYILGKNWEREGEIGRAHV